MAYPNPNVPRVLDDINEIDENQEGLANVEGLIDEEVSSLSMPEELSDAPTKVGEVLVENA